MNELFPSGRRRKRGVRREAYWIRQVGYRGVRRTNNPVGVEIHEITKRDNCNQ
jgi:hypothetical protein